MATQRNKKTRTPTQKPAGPAQPVWKQPPPKPRKQMRRHQAIGPKVAPQNSVPARGAVTVVRLAAKPRFRVREAVRLYGRTALLLLVVIGCAVGLLALLHLPQLTVMATTTEIGGSRRNAAEDVYAAAAVEGRNILLVKPADVARRVMEMSGIAGADVHVRLPNRVLIDVREYTPLVAVQGITTTLWLSADGAEVPQVGGKPPLTLKDRSGMSLGASQQTWRDLLPDLAEIQAARPDVSELFYGNLEGLYFVAPEGWTVWLGNGGPMAAKLALLDATRREILARGTHPNVIDLRYSATQAFLR